MPLLSDQSLQDETEDGSARLRQDWSDCKHRQCSEARLRVIEHYMPFAKMLAAKQFALRVESDSVFEDYCQWAMEGLIESVDRYDPDTGVPFEAFCRSRIRGVILNQLEQASEASAQFAMRARLRKARVKSILAQQDLTKCNTESLFNQLAELAVGLAVGLMLEDTGMYHDAERETVQHAEPYRTLEFSQLRKQVRDLVDALPERESKVLRYHYFFGFQFDAIAELMQLSAGRITQLHKQALQRLRAMQKGPGRLDMRL